MSHRLRLIAFLKMPLLLTLQPSFFVFHSAMAQTANIRKVEADQLLKQGNEKLNTNQTEAAIQPLQQALAISQCRL